MTYVSVDGNAGGGALVVTITFEDGSVYAGIVEPAEHEYLPNCDCLSCVDVRRNNA